MSRYRVSRIPVETPCTPCTPNSLPVDALVARGLERGSGPRVWGMNTKVLTPTGTSGDPTACESWDARSVFAAVARACERMGEERGEKENRARVDRAAYSTVECRALCELNPRARAQSDTVLNLSVRGRARLSSLPRRSAIAADFVLWGFSNRALARPAPDRRDVSFTLDEPRVEFYSSFACKIARGNS